MDVSFDMPLVYCLRADARGLYSRFIGHLKFRIIEPVHEKTNNLGFRPGPTQTGLYSHRSRLEA